MIPFWFLHGAQAHLLVTGLPRKFYPTIQWILHRTFEATRELCKLVEQLSPALEVIDSAARLGIPASVPKPSPVDSQPSSPRERG